MLRSETTKSSAAALGSDEDEYVCKRDDTERGTADGPGELEVAELEEWVGRMLLGETVWELEERSGRCGCDLSRKGVVEPLVAFMVDDGM